MSTLTTQLELRLPVPWQLESEPPCMVYSHKPVIVLGFGGRELSRKQMRVAREHIPKALATLRCTLLVHGDARGADRLFEEIAMSMHIPVMVIPPLWRVHGKAAGVMRNGLMCQVLLMAATHYNGEIVALQLPGKRGTTDMATKIAMVNDSDRLPQVHHWRMVA